MHQATCFRNFATALAFASLSPIVPAQTAVTFKSTCQDVGMSGREPLGDREGHAITVGQYSCKNEGGVADGSLMSGMVIWEWDKTSAVMQAGNGVVRRPGAFAVYQNSEGKVSLTVTDGKVTGLSGTSKGVYKTATGGMASLAGKSFRSTFKSIGGGQFVIEETIE